eukprot:CAMPEP_0175249264 /NCGR_PEP_ID=MMETSP0093-20121207/34557_1 /TAXON_ID=311494 /ORGANISM="Alexandrium monilatum, Strain CCMP3105" /LENGTH=212 /DNA_ID=CAMNT_0016543491 /DNA_START=92 /DNA_END=726 /DNA_ORIENTATION=-
MSEDHGSDELQQQVLNAPPGQPGPLGRVEDGLQAVPIGRPAGASVGSHVQQQLAHLQLRARHQARTERQHQRRGMVGSWVLLIDISFEVDQQLHATASSRGNRVGDQRCQKLDLARNAGAPSTQEPQARPVRRPRPRRCCSPSGYVHGAHQDVQRSAACTVCAACRCPLAKRDKDCARIPRAAGTVQTPPRAAPRLGQHRRGRGVHDEGVAV